MTGRDWLQLAGYVGLVLLLAWPLGHYMARVYQGDGFWATRLLGWLERALLRMLGIAPDAEMAWTGYAAAVLVFSAVGFAGLYLLQRGQQFLPLNPAHLGGVAPTIAFNTAISFVTNTNWQAYSGETTLSYLTQMAGLTVQNFVSAATGMAVLVALIRGFTRRNAATIGNFWVDLVRGTVYILLPLSTMLALALVSQGVVQTFRGPATAELVEPQRAGDSTVTHQVIARAPAASQVAIKQLGTNGGGVFGVNSAHPFENPTPLSNLLEMLAILLIPAALCHTYGRMVGDTRQGWAILAAMTIVFVPLAAGTIAAEQHGTAMESAAGADLRATDLQAGGNMEGKEVRFGIANSALWATATTAASNGSVNAMHDSFTPLGGLAPLWLMQLGEVIFGGVGSGLYGMLIFGILAVFIAGLMVGRTPEFLGKKIEAYEVKMAMLVVLIPAICVLLGTAAAVSLPAGRGGAFNAGPHGFSEILYAFSSAGNNNGSAFAGLNAGLPFYAVALAIAMVLARFWLMVPVLAIAGSLARKKRVPEGAGTLSTASPLFVGLLLGTVILIGALTFLPALALGPIVEHLLLRGP